MKTPEVMLAIADLCFARGEAPVNKYAGCWECEVDEHWWVALNGHLEPVACSRGPSVPQFSMYVEFNGWPAGIIDTGDGVIAAGELANEDTFLAAVREATRRVTS